MGAGVPVIILLLAYGWLTGASGSTLRAITMLIMAMIADILGRTYDMLTAIGVAAILQLVEYPSRLFDAGFLLSFGAVLALGLVLPACKDILVQREIAQKGDVQMAPGQMKNGKKESLRCRLIKKFKEALFSGIIVQIITGPIVIFFYYEYPTYGILLNLYVIPMMTPVILLGLLSLLLAPWSLTLAGLAGLPCEWILKSFTVLCRAVQELPGAVWHTGGISVWLLVVYYAALILIYGLMRMRRERSGLAIVGLLAGIMLCRDYGGMQITMLDVGQGDSVLIETKEHQFLLIDGGSTSRSSVGKYVITSAAKYYGTGRIDYIFVTHMDEDHVNGIRELMELSEQGGIEIGCLVLPLAGKDNDAFGYPKLEELAEEAGIPVLYIRRGEAIESKSMRLECLYPGNTFTFSDANNNSMVLQLTMGDVRMLFMGDLERQGEKVLCDIYAEAPAASASTVTGYDVLKVGHHGSSGASSTELLEWINPDYALISCGKNNTYGHPHAEALERLQAIGAEIYRTDCEGAIIIRQRKGELYVSGIREDSE